MNRNFVAFVALTAIGIVPGIPAYARDHPAQPPAAGAAGSSVDEFSFAVDLQEAGKYTEAIAKYTQLIAMRKTFSDCYLNRGICYTEIGELESALSDFDYYISRKPHRVEGYVGRASVFQLQKKYKKALDDLKVAFAKAQTPRERVPMIYSRGNAYLAMGDYDKAIDEYTKYLSQSRESGLRIDPLAYQNRGNAHMMRYRALEKRDAPSESRKAYEDAQRDFAEYERLKPKTPQNP